MPKMYINKTFQHKGKIHRSNEEGNVVLSVTGAELRAEMEKGKCTKHINGVDVERWVSGLLAHCTPADKDAKRIVLGEKFDEEADNVEAEMAKKEKEDKVKALAEEKASIQSELDSMGRAYDKRTGVDKLRDILKQARIEAGV